MRNVVVLLQQAELVTKVEKVLGTRGSLTRELAPGVVYDLCLLDEERLRRLAPALLHARSNGRLRSVLLLAPSAGLLALEPAQRSLVDDFVEPGADSTELDARISLAFERAIERAVEATCDDEGERYLREQGFRALTEDSPDVVVRYDRDGRYLFANAALCRATGLTPEQVLGKTHAELGFASEHADFWDSTIRHGFETGESARVEYTFPTPDGVRFFESRLSPERARDGSIASVMVVSRDMTDRWLVEAQLRVSEARLDEALALARTGSWEVDPETGNAVWSKELHRLLGYDPRDTVPTLEGMLARVHPEDVGALQADLANTGEGARSMEFRVILPGGEVRHLLSHARTSVDLRTKRVRVLGAISDITERRFSELERESERALLEMVARGAPLEECLERMTLNQEALFPGSLCCVSTLGEGEHASLARPAARFDTLRLVAGLREHPEARNAMRTFEIGPRGNPCARSAFTKKRVIAVELLESEHWSEYRRVAQELGVHSCVSVPIFSSRKEVLGTFAMHLRETREPSQEELRCVERAASLAGLAIERHRNHGALAESEALLRTVFDHSPIGIYLCDPDGRVVYMNRAVDALLGVEKSNLLGKGWFRFLHPDDKHHVAESLAGLMEGRTQSVDLAWRQLRPDGGMRTLQVHASAMHAGGGRRGFVGTVEDISARLKFEEQIRHGQKMEAVGQLAGGVAHDFNNLLTVILNGVSLIKAPGTARDRELLRQIELAAERAAALTRQLLAFGRRQRMAPQLVDLNDLVSTLCGMLRRLIGEQIALETQLAAGGAPARVDPNMIEQVLVNLVVNARDAMPRGGTIGLRLDALMHTGGPVVRPGAEPQPYLRLSVSDTGVGITKDDLSHVFEPFFTTKETGKGTGLGLATVYAIVEQHGGFIEVDSQVGRGTAVHVFLPRSTAAVRRAPTAFLAAPRGNETLLLVEDEPAVREMVRTSLESCGYQVLEAASGDLALPIWREHRQRIRLLLTDMVMPGSLLGGELSQRLRAEKPDLRVVYMSGYGGQDLKLDSTSRFVSKPFQVSTLGRVVRECLDATPDEALAEARALSTARHPLPSSTPGRAGG
jgi:PAS domain S-box-containing protein